MAIRKIKPNTPGQRFMTVSTYEEITCTTPERSLMESLKSNAGRNNKGRITVRHRGGGAKRQYRIIDFKRNKDNIPAKVANEKLIVLDSIELPEQKTRAMVKVLANLKVEKALIVTSDVCDTVVRTARNIQGVATATVGTLNTYDVLKYDALILTKDAVEKVEEVYA